MIDLEGVCFTYPNGHAVLRDLSFSCREGDRIGVVGSNGSGKTTFLHVLVGLLTPQEGRVVLFGRERRTEEDFRDARRGMGFVFQDADDQLFCPTVAEDVAFGPRNLGRSAEEAHETVHRTLELLGIEHLEREVPYHLSGGEKRLAALATVLAMEPRVLILDEPTAGLDARTEERVLGILERHVPTVVVVSHDRPFLGRCVSRRVRLEGGRFRPETMG